MRAVLAKIERTVPGLARPAQRLPMVALHFLFYEVYGVEPERHEQSVRFLEGHLELFDAPSPESMIAHVVLNQDTGWTAAQFREAWAAYLAQRFRRDALVLPRLFEAACLLTLAEIHRREADTEAMRAAVTSAVETMPGLEQLLELERECATDDRAEVPIDWRTVLLPVPDEPSEAQAHDAVSPQAGQHTAPQD